MARLTVEGEDIDYYMYVCMFTGDTRKVYKCMYKCIFFTMDLGGGTYSLSVLPTVVKGN